MEFEDLTAELQEGRQDSVGQFTVNSARSESQFAKQVALQPHLFLGQLLQAANLADASQVCYTTQPDEMFVQIVLHDGSPFIAWMDFFVGRKPPEGPIQQYLHQAFGCARALKPKRLHFHVVGPEVCYCVDLLDGTLVESPRANQVQGLLLELATPPRRWRFIERWLSAPIRESITPTAKTYLDDKFRTPEEFVLLKCCFSTVPVYLNGKPVRFRPCRPTKAAQLPLDPEVGTQPESPFKLVHMTLADRSLPSSCWFDGPAPGSFQSLTAVVTDHSSGLMSRYGTEAEQLKRILHETDWRTTWVLSLEIPRLSSESDRKMDSWKVSCEKGGFSRWSYCEGLSPLPLLCGAWVPAQGWRCNQYRLTSLFFLKIHERFLRRSPVSIRDNQLCCSRFIGVRHGLGSACLVPVKDGLALSAESPPTWSKGSFIIAVEPGLKVDLNGIQAVKDGAYETLLTDCEGQLTRLGRYSKARLVDTKHAEQTMGSEV